MSLDDIFEEAQKHWELTWNINMEYKHVMD